IAYAIPTNHIHELFRWFIASSVPRPAPAAPAMLSLLAVRSRQTDDSSSPLSSPSSPSMPAASREQGEEQQPTTPPDQRRSESMADPSVVKHFPTLGVILEAATEMLPQLLGYDRFWRRATQQEVDPGAAGRPVAAAVVCP